MAVTVRANSGTAIKRAIARDAVRWFVAEGMPIKKDIRVNIHFVDGMKDNYGEADWNGWSLYHSRSYTLKISNQIKDLDLLLATVLHEMVHVHQFATRRRNDRLDAKADIYQLFWKGKEYTKANYDDQPWEVEAFEAEEKLINRFLAHKRAI